MGYREVRIYGGEFPTPDQILSGDPTSPPFPKEVWLQQVQLFEGDWITSSVRLLTAAGLVWLCITGRWGAQPSEVSAGVRPPVLQPLS